MHARMTTFAPEPHKIDKLIKATEEVALPTLEKQKGFKNLLYLTNRHTNECIAIVLWDTKADMTAGEARGFYLLDMLLKAVPFETKPPTREDYEVSIQG